MKTLAKRNIKKIYIESKINLMEAMDELAGKYKDFLIKHNKDKPLYLYSLYSSRVKYPTEYNSVEDIVKTHFGKGNSFSLKFKIYLDENVK